MHDYCFGHCTSCPVVEEKSLKKWMLPLFSTGALPKGAKREQKIVSLLNEGKISIARSLSKKTTDSIKIFNHVDCITPSSQKIILDLSLQYLEL
jgi:hypothetical protein